MRWSSGVLAVGVVVAVAGGLTGGCASPGQPGRVAKPPGQVVPGVGTAGPGPSSGSSSDGSSRDSSPSGSARLTGSVLVGGWAPGGAGDPVAAGALAYFRWLDARGGVDGRAVIYQVLDDRGNSRVVPSLVHQLVQGESVFAVFGAQGGQGSAVTGFLDVSGVPDVFAGPGCGCLGVPARLAEVFGWATGEGREGKVLGAWAARRYQGARMAVAYEPDMAGRNGLAAFTAEARGVRVAARIALQGSSSARAAVAVAKAARARVLVAFTSPGVVAALAKAMAAARWRVPLVVASSGLGSGLPDGVITDGFLPSTGMSASGPAGRAAATWVALFRKIRDQYLPRSPLSPAVIGGMSAAYEFASALFRAGQNLSRPRLIAALDGLPPGPAAVPLVFSPDDHGGAQGGYVGVIRGGVLVPLSDASITSATAGGPVTPYAGSWAAAPVDGIPVH